MNDVNEQDFYFSFNKEPQSLTFDPDNQIILKNASTVVGGKVSKVRNFAITVHPNPAKERTLLSFYAGSTGVYTYTLVDLAGNIIKSGQKTITAAGEYTIEIPTGEYPAGMYIVTLSNGEVNEYSKFSVIH